MAVKKKAAAKKATARKTPAKKALKKAVKTVPAEKPAPKKSEAKTKPTAASVREFISKVDNPARRKDAETALSMYKAITGLDPKLWGPSIIGYGSYHYKYDSGREGDMCAAGFSPRSSSMVFYVMGGVADDDPMYKRLGKYKLGSSCLYVNRLTDVDVGVLGQIIAKSWAYMKKTYPVAP
jgi:hypothetical protein